MRKARALPGCCYFCWRCCCCCGGLISAYFTYIWEVPSLGQLHDATLNTKCKGMIWNCRDLKYIHNKTKQKSLAFSLVYIDCIVQDCSNPIANALESLQTLGHNELNYICRVLIDWLFSASLALCAGISPVTGEFPLCLCSTDRRCCCARTAYEKNSRYAADTPHTPKDLHLPCGFAKRMQWSRRGASGIRLERYVRHQILNMLK